MHFFLAGRLISIGYRQRCYIVSCVPTIHPGIYIKKKHLFVKGIKKGINKHKRNNIKDYQFDKIKGLNLNMIGKFASSYKDTNGIDCHNCYYLLFVCCTLHKSQQLLLILVTNVWRLDTATSMPSYSLTYCNKFSLSYDFWIRFIWYQTNDFFRTFLKKKEKRKLT